MVTHPPSSCVPARPMLERSLLICSCSPLAPTGTVRGNVRGARAGAGRRHCALPAPGRAWLGGGMDDEPARATRRQQPGRLNRTARRSTLTRDRCRDPGLLRTHLRRRRGHRPRRRHLSPPYGGPRGARRTAHRPQAPATCAARAGAGTRQRRGGAGVTRWRTRCCHRAGAGRRQCAGAPRSSARRRRAASRRSAAPQGAAASARRPNRRRRAASPRRR
mmetsp:Transcript_17153/g.60228  ORF Transcript_17153/g.60228 Transcript_17153/m.60228 type:complete len:219 (-) Transcript_17153:139-795(-)